ncbi:conserved hypothetical protein [Theileria orientalis strain Shintoku]|uniref:Uncharacterized protein n=1 Tax=Theileria orientalis strain Shintoku TaxID=869250 RepID=J4C8G6_THEOR|nr:conserved hypothetical protein [Theileria orientalis strain Shintoku]BAM40753.1 conserved hypothetical protein [Theileria orientalis strain Shintoku]|eukprot:XP_009691054.1 conserved hypothetical protein [Theileria orientalis strain Shintoku]
MNLCSISIYLLICIYLRHGKETAVFADDAQAGTVATSGDSVPKSGANQTGSSPEGSVSQQGSTTQSSNPSDPPNVVLVPLDIDSNTSSDQFTFEQSGNDRTYTVKDNYLINELRKGTGVIHTFESPKYPYKVTITKNNDKEDLRILFPTSGLTEASDAEIEDPGKPAQTHTASPTMSAPVPQARTQQAQVTQPQPSQPTQSQSTVLTPARRLAVSSFTEPGKALAQDHLGQSHQNFAANLHFSTITNNDVKQDDTTQYQVFIGQDGYIYGFKDEARCVEVKHGTATLWRIGEPADFPNRVEFSIGEPPHVIIASKNQNYTYRLINGRWLLGSHFTNTQSMLDISKITIHMGTDASCAQVVIDENKYTIKTFDELNIFFYDFMPNVFCAAVIYDNQYLWKYDANFGNNYPKRIYFHKDVMTVVVDFAAFYLVYKFDQAWKFDSKVDKNEFKEDQIEIVTIESMNNSQVINDFTQYRVIEHYYLRQFKFRSIAKCVSLRYMQKEVWARNIDFGNYYPKSIVYNINTGNFFVDFDANWYYVYVFDKESDKWYPVHKDESKKPAELPEVAVGIEPPQQANQSQNANPNTRVSDQEGDDIDVRDMRSGSMGSDPAEGARAGRSGSHGSIGRGVSVQEASVPRKKAESSDIEVHEVRAGAADSDASDLEFVRKEAQKGRPADVNIPTVKGTKRLNTSDIEVQEVRMGGHTSLGSDMVVEEVRVGRKRNYDSDVIVEEVRHGQYDSDESDIDVMEIRRGQKDSDDSDFQIDDRGGHSARGMSNVREVRHGDYDSYSSGMEVREVRHGEYDSDASEFDVREVRRGAYDSDASQFDVEEVRYGSNTDSSGMRVREVRHGDFDSDASEAHFKTRGPQGHQYAHGGHGHHYTHGGLHDARGHRFQHHHHRHRDQYYDPGQFHHPTYGSPYDYHTHNLHQQYQTYAQRRMPGQRYVPDGYGHSSHGQYDSYDFGTRGNNLVHVDVMYKRSNRFVAYIYDRHSHCDIFTSRPPYLFSSVLLGGQLKWQAQRGRYPNRVVVQTDRYGQSRFRVFFPKEEQTSHYKRMQAYDESTVDSETEHRRFRGPHTHTQHHRYYNRAERHVPAHNYYEMPTDAYKQFGSRASPMYSHKEPQSFSESEQFMGRHPSSRHYDPSAPFQIQYEYDHGKVVGVLCNGYTIWRRQRHDPYPQSTKCISDILMIAIIFNKFHFHIYKYNGTRWNRIRASVERIIELDISKKSSSENYYYASKNHVDTYIAVEKYLFNKVKLSYLQGYHTLSTDIWTTDVPTEYADKIIVNRFGRLSTRTEVTIHFINGCEVTYLSAGLMKTFYRYRWSETASKISDDIQIMTLDDHGGYEINNVTKFDIYAHWRVDKPESAMKGIYKYEVVFYQHARCVKVRMRNRKIFKTNPNLSGNFPTKITFNLETNKYYFEFSDDVYNYVFEEKIPSYLAKLTYTCHPCSAHIKPEYTVVKDVNGFLLNINAYKVNHYKIFVRGVPHNQMTCSQNRLTLIFNQSFEHCIFI